MNLILQAVGGGIASSAKSVDLTNVGINIVITGLVSQVCSLLAFICLSGDFARRVWKMRIALEPSTSRFVQRPKWRFFLLGTFTTDVASSQDIC